MIKNCRGDFFAAVMGSLPWCASPAVVESVGYRGGVILGLQLGVRSVMLESDSETFINTLNDHIVASQESGSFFVI